MLPPMNLDLTLGCGQVFRWFKVDEWWSGVVGGKEVSLKESGGSIEVRGEAPIEDLIRYFRPEDDLEAIYEEIAKDDLMRALTSRFGGLRLVRQDPWECSLSYILATNANFPRIQRMVESVCTEFGHRLPGGRYSFPTAREVLDGEERATGCGLGYRCGRLVKFAGSVEEGALDFKELMGMEYEDCIAYLKGFEGIGDKVADCIALFSLDHLQAFPVDVRIRRVMEKVYGASGSYRRIREQGQNYFGKYAGYAQELLYHWDGTT